MHVVDARAEDSATLLATVSRHAGETTLEASQLLPPGNSQLLPRNKTSIDSGSAWHKHDNVRSRADR
jgi:hypothetical protein